MVNENSASLILVDTALEQAYIDEEQLANSAEMENAGFRKTLWKKYGDPVGRIGQKTYIVRALLVGIPTAAMFAFTWIRPELFVGDANIFILSFMVLGTLVSCRSSVWRYAAFRISVFPIYTTGDSSAFFL